MGIKGENYVTNKKMRANHVIDFAAEELKKYLKMMMPDAGDVSIEFEPNATEGFRLGLLEDFLLKNEAKDVLLDDVIHIDTDVNGGIFAGSNPEACFLPFTAFSAKTVAVGFTLVLTANLFPLRILSLLNITS